MAYKPILPPTLAPYGVNLLDPMQFAARPRQNALPPEPPKPPLPPGLLDPSIGGGGNQSGSAATTQGTAGNEGTSVPGQPHGNPGMMSPQGIGLTAATSMMGPAGMIGTIGQGLNMMQAMGLLSPANLSPSAIAIANDPAAIAMLDPDGTIAIAPPTDSMMFEVVTAQQNGMGAGDSGVTAGPGSPGSGGSTGNDDPSDGDAGWRYGGPVPDDKDGKLEGVRGLLHEGEYVIRPEMVKKYGKGLLSKINEGKLPARGLLSSAKD